MSKLEVLAAVLIVVLLTARESNTLACNCSDCPGGFCVLTSGSGDSCFAAAQRNTSHPNKTVITRGCYNPSASINFCGKSSSQIVIKCCKTHNCNTLLTPELPTTTVKPPTGPTVELDPLQPTETTASPPQRGPNIICEEYNSKKPCRKTSFCQTLTGSCYILQRFASDGSITSERRGCSEQCSNERRNRLHRHCCNTSLCNSRNIRNQLPCSSTTETMSVTASTLSLPSQTVTATTNRVPSIVPIQTQLPTGGENLIGQDTGYITLILLSIAYVTVGIFIFFLVGLLCYKQKQLNDLKNSINVKRCEASQKSLETLSSGDTV